MHETLACLERIEKALQECQRTLANINDGHFFAYQQAEAALSDLRSLKESLQGKGLPEPVGWAWRYIGNAPYPLGLHANELIARGLHELDPKDNPYPTTWEPVAPLYTAEAILKGKP